MENAIEFLKKIEEKDEIIIIFHNDTDGCCSAALMDKFLEQRTGKQADLISQPMPTDKYLIKRIQTGLPNKLIFLDLAVDQQQGLLKNLGGICDILIIDHHQIFRNMNLRNIVHFNPRFKKRDIYQSASYLVFKLCSQIVDMAKYRWIAAVGTIADYNLDDSQDLINDLKKQYPDMPEKPYDSRFGRIADMIEAAKATKALTCEQIVRFLMKLENPEDMNSLQDSEKFINAFKEVENELVGVLVDADKNKEVYGKLIMYDFKSKYNLRSPVSTKLSEKFNNSVVVIYEKIGNKIKISARDQSKKMDVAYVLRKASHGLKTSTGGHIAAAGGTVEERDWKKFKENLIAIFQNN